MGPLTSGNAEKLLLSRVRIGLDGVLNLEAP
jgi:hypothetical protein